MPQWLQWSLIIAGLIAIVLLAVFIRRQMGLLSENRKRQAKAEAFQTNRRQDMIRSVHVIAMAVEEDQIEYSEACLRQSSWTRWTRNVSKWNRSMPMRFAGPQPLSDTTPFQVRVSYSSIQELVRPYFCNIL